MFFRKKAKSKKHDGPSLSSDIAATRKAGIKTAILVTFLVSGIVPALSMMFNPASEGLPFVQQMQQMWSIALVTYPLTIVVATLTILRQRGILRFGNLFLATSIVIFCVSVGNTIGVFGGHQASVAKADTRIEQTNFNSNIQDQTWTGSTTTNFAPKHSHSHSQPRSFWDLPAACLGFFTSYLKLYGLRTFLASVLVGIFAGRTASRFLEYVPANRQETIGLAKEIYETHRQMRSANSA